MGIKAPCRYLRNPDAEIWNRLVWRTGTEKSPWLKLQRYIGEIGWAVAQNHEQKMRQDCMQQPRAFQHLPLCPENEIQRHLLHWELWASSHGSSSQKIHQNCNQHYRKFFGKCGRLLWCNLHLSCKKFIVLASKIKGIFNVALPVMWSFDRLDTLLRM